MRLLCTDASGSAFVLKDGEIYDVKKIDPRSGMVKLKLFPDRWWWPERFKSVEEGY